MPRLSLTTRLTLFFTAFAAVVVLGLGGLFMAAADHHFVELDELALADKRQLVGQLLQEAGSAEEARRALSRALDHQSTVRVEVRAADGELLFRSALVQATVHPAANGAPISSHRRGAKPAASATAPEELDDQPAAVEGHSGLRRDDGMMGAVNAGAGAAHSASHALAFTLEPGWGSEGPLRVELAIDTAFHAQFLRELRWKLGGYALVATLLAGLLGWLAAHQGLAPLRAMKKRAAAVSAQRLEPRMPEAAVPVEMADLAAELNRMLERLRDDFRRLSEFSSDLAHELRTPISNLLTQTQVTLSARRDAGTYRDTLASNAEELERLGRMVADMLFLAKTERGVDLPRRERVELGAEVRAVAEFHEAVAEERGIALTVTGEASLEGDRLMLRRALGNLLSNALRHAPAGGMVAIHLRSAAGGVEVAVENDGEPIPPEFQARLFDRFFSADPARAHPAAEGTGLGLAITRAIVEAHGGRIRLESDTGPTRFVMAFPGD